MFINSSAFINHNIGRKFITRNNATQDNSCGWRNEFPIIDFDIDIIYIPVISLDMAEKNQI